MGADASIYNLIKPVAPQPGPLDQYTQGLQLKHLMGQRDLQAMQLQQARQGMADDEAVRQFYSQPGDPRARIGDLFKVSPKAGFAAQKSFQDADKSAADLDKVRAEAAIKKAEYLRDGLAGVRDQNSYSAWLQDATARGAAIAKSAPQAYDPNWQRQNIFTADKWIEQQNKDREFGLNAANQPFTAGVAGPVANTPVQSFMLEKAKKSAPNVNVKTEVKTGESLAAQVGPMMKDSTAIAEGAVKQVDAAQRIVRAVETNKLFTGPGANARIGIAQVGELIGVGGKDNEEKLTNTRQAIRGLAELTLQGRQQMKGQGAITESEGKLAERAMSGEIDFTAAEIKQLAKASERAARFNYGEHQRKMKVMQSNEALSPIAPFYQGPDMPPEVPEPSIMRQQGLNVSNYSDAELLRQLGVKR